MHSWNYKGWTIHETFLSESVRPASIENGVKVQPPNGIPFRVKSVHAAKCIITRRTPA